MTTPHGTRNGTPRPAGAAEPPDPAGTGGAERPLAAAEVLALHRLSRRPDTASPRHLTWRMEREGLLAPGPGGVGQSITGKGRAALARALARPPRLNPHTVATLAAINRAGPDGLRGFWPGEPSAMDVARLFRLVRSEPANRTYARWWLTEAGQQALSRHRAAQRATRPASSTQARVLHAVAVGQRLPVAADRSYTSCHNCGWLTPATPTGHRRSQWNVTRAGWQALRSYHRRVNLPLHLPVHALVEGHVVRLTYDVEPTGERVRVVRTEAIFEWGLLVGYLLIATGRHGHAKPYADRRPLPADTHFELVDYQPHPPRTGTA